MKRVGIIVFMSFLCHLAWGQIHELGLYAGGSNFIGDVGATNYISPNQFAYGAVYRWNQSPRHSFRANLSFTELEGIDNNSDDPRRILRDYSFNTRITEASIGMEFTFFEFDLHAIDFMSTPYIYGGVSAARFDSFYINNTGTTISENTAEYAWGIPFGLGYKAQIFPKVILGFEIAARYTFSDSLDGSFPGREENQQFAFGNINNNDWYMFTGLMLTYTFGKNPCFCPFTE